MSLAASSSTALLRTTSRISSHVGRLVLSLVSKTMETFYVDARFRASGSPSDFTWALRETMHCSDGSQVRADQVKLVNSLWTVEQENRYVYFSFADNVLVQVPLELGFYDGNSMAAHLSLHLGSFGFRAQYVPTSNSVVINNVLPFRFWTDDQIANAPIARWTGFAPETSPGTPLSFNDILKNPGGAVVTDTQYTIVYYNASRVSEIYLTCQEFISRHCHGPIHGENNILCRIDVNQGPGNILTGTMPMDLALAVGDHSFKAMHFRLQTANGKPIILHDDSLCFILVIS